MVGQAKLLFLAGSARRESLNKKLARTAAQQARDLGAEVRFVDLADYPLPLYNGDLEKDSGIPDAARALRQLFMDHQGFAIASPEYNSGFTPLLKNTLDWISRPDGEVPGLVAFKGKTAQLLATSPGGLGGMRGLVMLRMMLSNIGVLVMPEQLAIPEGNKVLDPEGHLVDERRREQLRGLLEGFIRRTAQLQ